MNDVMLVTGIPKHVLNVLNGKSLDFRNIVFLQREKIKNWYGGRNPSSLVQALASNRNLELQENPIYFA